MDPKFEVFKSEADGQHYWRLVASNGAVIATGGEGFSSKAAAYRATGTVTAAVTAIANAKVQAAFDAEASQIQEEGSEV